MLLFQGSLHQVELVRGLCSSLDVAAAEVLVKASVFEVQTTKDDSSGVQIALNILGAAISGGVGSVAAPVLAFAKGGFSLAVSRLASDSRFKLVSSPTLRVTSGESARVMVGQDVPVLGALTVTASGAPVQSVNYQSSGVSLNISPVVLGRVVRVTLKQEISDFANTTTGVNGSPTLLTRSVSSVVGLHAGEVVFLGGLDQSDDTDTKSGSPWLPKFFASSTGIGDKTELVVMLEVDAL